MFIHLRRSYLCLRIFVLFGILSFTVLPVQHSLAAQSGTNVSENITAEKDTSSSEQVESVTETEKSDPEKQADVVAEQSEADETADDGDEAEKDDSEEDEGLSTLAKVGIGVGVVAAVGLVVGMAGGSSSGPSYPAPEDLLGAWHSEGVNLDDGRTYTGTYNFYAVGSHTYSIYTSDGESKSGNGNWTLAEGTYSLRMENDTGSVYKGDFAEGDYSNIVMKTIDGRWQVTLTR